LINNNHPRQIIVAGRPVVCESVEDRQLLQEAKLVEVSPADVLDFSVGRLHLIKDACQRYSLGKHQRLVSQAISRFGR
jgi:hypothetical protein